MIGDAENGVVQDNTDICVWAVMNMAQTWALSKIDLLKHPNNNGALDILICWVHGHVIPRITIFSGKCCGSLEWQCWLKRRSRGVTTAQRPFPSASHGARQANGSVTVRIGCASVWCQWCASFRNVAPNWSECVLFHCMKLPPSLYQPVSLSCVPFASHFKPPLLFYCPCLFVNTLRFSYTLHFSSWVLRAHIRLQWRCVEKCFGEKSRVKLWCYSV